MKNNPFLVAVAGPSCSGKSTLESHLSKQFGDELALLSFDDFFMGMQALGGNQVTNWDNPDLYRWPLYADIIYALHTGLAARFEPHSYEAKQAGVTERVIKPAPIVLVTGFLALYSMAANDYFDLKIYIDVPEDEMVRRRVERSKGRPAGPWNSEAYINNALIPATREFIAPQKTVANLVIDGLLPPEQISEQVADVIRQQWSS
jgi:uridine kinase